MKCAEHKRPLPVALVGRDPHEPNMYTEAGIMSCETSEDPSPYASVVPVGCAAEPAQARGRGRRKSAYIRLLVSPRRLFSTLIRTLRPHSSRSLHILETNCFTCPLDGCASVREAATREQESGREPGARQIFTVEGTLLQGTKPNSARTTKTLSHMQGESLTWEPPTHRSLQNSVPLRDSEEGLGSDAAMPCAGARPGKRVCDKRVASAPRTSDDCRGKQGAANTSAHSLPAQTSPSCCDAPQALECSATCGLSLQNAEGSSRWMDKYAAHGGAEQPFPVVSGALAASAPKVEAEGTKPSKAYAFDQHTCQLTAPVDRPKKVGSLLTIQNGCDNSGELPVAIYPRSPGTKACSPSKSVAPTDAQTKGWDGILVKIGMGGRGCSRRWCSRPPTSCDPVVPRRAAPAISRFGVTEQVKYPSQHGWLESKAALRTAYQSTGLNARTEGYGSDVRRSGRHRSGETDWGTSDSQSFVTVLSDAQDLWGQLQQSCTLLRRPFRQGTTSACTQGDDAGVAAHTRRDVGTSMSTNVIKPAISLPVARVDAGRSQAVFDKEHVQPTVLNASQRLLVNPTSFVVDGTAGKSTPAACSSAEDPHLLPCQEWEIPRNSSETEAASIKRRKRLPCPKNNAGNLSITKILMQVSSTDMWNFSLPIGVNEPLSLLQRLCEDFEYPELLSTARSCASAVERLAFVTAFAVSAYASSADRCYKPFNPMLGETYELSHRGINFIGEQVSHHPPVSAYHAAAHNGDFVCFGTVAPRLSIVGTHVECSNCGAVFLRLFLPSGRHEDYTWNRANTKVHNVFFGTMWMEWIGDISVVNLTSGEKAQVSFLPSAGAASTSQKPRSSQLTRGVTAGSWLPSLRLPGFPAADMAPSSIRAKASSARGRLTQARASQFSSIGDRSFSGANNRCGSSSITLTDVSERGTREIGERTGQGQNLDASSTVHPAHCSEGSVGTCTGGEGSASLKKSRSTEKKIAAISGDFSRPSAMSNASAGFCSLRVNHGSAENDTRGICHIDHMAPPTAAAISEGAKQPKFEAPTSADIWKASAIVHKGKSGFRRRASWVSRDVRGNYTLQGVVCDSSGRPRFHLEGSWTQHLWLTKIGRRSFLAANPEAATLTAEGHLRKTSESNRVASSVSAADKQHPAEDKPNAQISPLPSSVQGLRCTSSGWGGSDFNERNAGMVHDRGVENARSHESSGTFEEEQWCDDDLCALIWEAKPKPEYAMHFYNMTAFAMELNELTTDYNPASWALTGTGGVAPTDTRLRPDIRKYEEGAISAAQEEKNRLEAKQREKCREREAKGEKWTPRWFKRGKNVMTGEDDWLYNGLYWRERVCNNFTSRAHPTESELIPSGSAESPGNRFKMCPSLF